uniref:PCI domain-containing protein n=1 Tax=Ditylenchus dipsaci TaxID=166011 RepID=A0A915DUW3_9BILA
MEIDYTSQVDEALPKAEAIVRVGKVKEGVESLYPLEKQTRLGCDMKSNNRVVLAMSSLLCKKRSIIKYSIKNMIQACCEMVEKVGVGENEDKAKLIETLRTVTAGKIYVEVERARLTKRVVEKLEAEGKLEEARKMIMELQVETYGSMEIKRKVRYLLHQMRLTIYQKDYLRASFIGRKISTKFFDSEADDIQDMKLEYYKYMIEIGLNGEDYLDVCKHYRAVFATPKVQADPLKITEALKCVVLYVLLSPHNNEQWDLVHRIRQTRELEMIPEYRELLELFINQEIIGWKETVIAKFEPMLCRGNPASPPTDVFGSNEAGKKKFDRLRECVGEHNVRMVAKYYTEISFQRMAELLEMPIDEMEKFVCNLIKLTDILNMVSHLILKEEMVHKHLDIQGHRYLLFIMLNGSFAIELERSKCSSSACQCRQCTRRGARSRASSRARSDRARSQTSRAAEIIHEARTTMSQKGKKRLSYRGHLYLFEKFNADETKKFWKCEKYKADKCPKRMTTDSSNNIINELAEHNHDTNPGRKGVHDIKQSLRERARTQELPWQIISTANANQPDFVKGQVPNAFAQKKIIRRARAEFKDLHQHQLPENCTTVLLADSGKDVVDVDR